MIEIRNEAFTKGKAMMKSLRSDNQKEIKKLEKLKGAQAFEVSEDINQLRKSLDVYLVSKVLPVRYGTVIINGKLLQAFMKKLKGYEVEFEATEDKGFKVKYSKENSKGVLFLEDISKHFQGFPSIPELVVKQYVS